MEVGSVTIERGEFDNLRNKVDKLDKDVEFVKSQVSNHLPTTLKEHGAILAMLKADAYDRKAVQNAISRWFSIVMKILGFASIVVGLLFGLQKIL